VARKLRRKYPRFDEDYERLIVLLEQNPTAGDAIPGFAERVYKIRLASTDMKRGKSGGFRIVYYLLTEGQIIYLPTIYAKADREDINLEEIRSLLKELDLES